MRETEGELGRYSSTPEEAEARGSGAQLWWGRPACMEEASAFRRARGGQGSGRRGRRFWAFSGLNWTLGQKRSLLTSACSPT